MNIEELKEKGEYLGFCPVKGYIYSVLAGCGRWHVVALKDGKISTLITHNKHR